MAELYDPYDATTQEDPYPVYTVLRDEHPVWWSASRGFWALSRFDDVRAAAADHERFSSTDGVLIGQEKLARSAAGDPLMPMMVAMDPPRHDQLRKLVSRAFTPRRMVAMEDSIRLVTRELLDALLQRGEGDFVAEYAAPLPAIVIAEMMGVPREDRAQFRQWSDELVTGNPDSAESMGTALDAALALYGYFQPMLAERRATPREDLMSALLAAEVDGERLSEEELLGFCFLLLVAGNETTTNLIANAAVVLHERPEVRARLAAQPQGLALAVEELLRYESPAQGLARTLTTDVQLHGTTMRAGDRVLLLYGAANRDPREFPQADRFVVDRAAERQLAFGHGIHFCLGAALARMECRVAYEELLARAPQYRLGAGVRVHSGPIRGFAHLPVQLSASAVAPAPLPG